MIKYVTILVIFLILTIPAYCKHKEFKDFSVCCKGENCKISCLKTIQTENEAICTHNIALAKGKAWFIFGMLFNILGFIWHCLLTTFLTIFVLTCIYFSYEMLREWIEEVF